MMTQMNHTAPLEIYQLNHASLLIVMGQVRLLTDPWYEGTAFDEGWKLRWDNPEAIALAATATHLWVSHPHSDHLHLPTLQKICQINPNIIVLANRSYNYDMCGQFQALGFGSVQPFGENQTIYLTEHCTLQRISSGIIDSMLVIRWNNVTILNLNDCVLQKRALRTIARRIGKIDLLLCNFNHAGKLLHFPEKTPEEVQETLKAHYRHQTRLLAPNYVLPYASHHQYASPFSIRQNLSMLEPDDLVEAAPDIHTIPLYPGQCVKIDFSAPSNRPIVIGQAQDRAAEAGTSRVSAGLPDRIPSSKEFQDAAEIFAKRMDHSFGPLRRLLPSITVRIREDQRIMRMRSGRFQETADNGSADIEACAEKFLHWLSLPYGTDSFVVGGHFGILRPCIGRIKLLFAILLLAEGKISPRYLIKPSLWLFLFRRYHELLAALLSLRVSSSYQ